MGKKCRTPEEKVQWFIDKSEKIPSPYSWLPGECWITHVSKNQKGYGLSSYKGKFIKAHRFMFEQKYGSLGEYHCLHHCDRPGCINPDHLFVGDAKSNNQDCIQKGRDRKAYGENHSNAKLNTSQVQWVRLLYAYKIYTLTEMAKKLNVSSDNLSKICLGQSRKEG